MSSELFGGELEGGRSTLQDVVLDLKKSLNSLNDLEDTKSKVIVRSPSLVNAVQVKGECPSGLVGCDDKILYEKTAGRLSCPGIDDAPDPLIVDGKGRVCYAGESIREVFAKKGSLNVDTLIREFSERLMKLTEGNPEILKQAALAAVSGSRTAPILVNMYSNNIYVTNFVTAFNAANPTAQLEKDVFIAQLTKFSAKLDAGSGADFLQVLLTPVSANSGAEGPFDTNGGNTHSKLSTVLFNAIVAFSRDQAKLGVLAGVVNTLAQVFPVGELAGNLQKDDDKKSQAEAAAANAVAFIPKSMKDLFVDADSKTKSNKLEFFRIVRWTIWISLLEAFNTQTDKFQSMMKALRVSYDSMRNVRDVATKLLQKRAAGEPVLSEEIDRVLAAKSKADQYYVSTFLETATTIGQVLGFKIDKDATLLADDDTLYFKKSIANMISYASTLSASDNAQAKAAGRAVNFFVAQYNLDVINLRNNTKRADFVASAYKVKLSPTTGPGEQDPYIAKAFFDNASTFAPLVVSQGQKTITESSTLKASEFCFVHTLDGKVIIRKRVTPASADEIRTTNSKVTAFKNYLRTGQTDLAKTLLEELSIGEVNALLGQTCAPIDEGEFAFARTYKVLTPGRPFDDYFAKNVAAKVGNDTSSLYSLAKGGLNSTLRDIYNELSVVFNKFGDVDLIATMLDGAAVPNGIAQAITRGGQFLAAHGNSNIGGGDIAGGEKLNGGNDEMDLVDVLLEGGDIGAPKHSMPDSVYKGAGTHLGPKPNKMRAILDKLEKRYDIATIYTGPSCPSYLKETNNTFGTQGNKKWVKTHHPWEQCMQQMGMQFVSEDGYCYPYGSSCYDPNDLVEKTKDTERTMQNWQELANIYNTVLREKYKTWRAGEIIRIRSDIANAGMSDEDVEKLLRQNIPHELREVPEFGAIQTMVTISSQIKDEISELTKSSDPVQREKIRKVLLESRALSEEWSDYDKVREAAQRESTAERLLAETKTCTEKSIELAAKTAPTDLREVMTTEATRLTNCTSLDLDHNKAVLIPKSINNRINKVALAKGEPVDPIVQWWRNYYAAKLKETKEKEDKVDEKISPLLDEDQRKVTYTRETASGSLEKALEQALDGKARSILHRA